MKISDVILKLNGEMTVPAVAKELNVSKDTLSRRLKAVGYEYNNSTKKYEFKGELSEKNKVDTIIFSAESLKNAPKKSDKNNKKITKNVEKNNDKIRENVEKNNDKIKEDDDVSLTKEEKLFLKKMCEHQTDIRLSVEFSMLPLKKKTKKHQMEISEQTYNDFEDYAKRMKDKRFSKNDLVEIALVRLMREFR